MGVLTACIPRDDVLNGELNDALFAASFGDVVAHDPRAHEVYTKAGLFFANTHPAAQLRSVVQTVFRHLADPTERGRTLRLSTGFGGGKTHTLLALWHLANNISNPTLGTDLLPAAGRPAHIRVAAIDAGKAGIPVFARHDGIETGSLWGELAFQLGGWAGWKAFESVDRPAAQPDETLVRGMFPDGPVLILLDELVIYMGSLDREGQGGLLNFVNKLMSEVEKRPQTVLVITDPAEQSAYMQEAAALAAKMGPAGRLDDIIARMATDFDPIGDEAAQVITRRLFERIDTAAAQKASALYHSLYARVAAEQSGALPAMAQTPKYAESIVASYPFHPRLLLTAQDRLGAIQEFNKSRGVLRLFARIIRNVWNQSQDLGLITAGELDWDDPAIRGDLLARLNKGNFSAAAHADVGIHAGELDQGAPRGVHRRVASALLLESLPLNSNSGLDPADATLAVLRPDEAGTEPADALHRLTGVCWHTYPSGRLWQFRYEPNVIKQIEERVPTIPREDARDAVLTEVQAYFSGPAFKLQPWPATPAQVQISGTLTLALCTDESIARAVCDYEDAEHIIPRRFTNSIIAVAPGLGALDDAILHAQRYKALQEIEKEHAKGDEGRMIREQISRLKPGYQRTFRLQSVRAFDRVVIAGRPPLPLEEKFLVSEDGALGTVKGQTQIRAFLDEKKLIYQAQDALDPQLLVESVLPGAVPLSGQPDVWTARALHERILSAPGLRLVADEEITRRSIIKAVESGRLVVRTASGDAYGMDGVVRGPEGERRRTSGSLSTFAVSDDVWLALAESDTARAWLRVDEPAGPGYPPPPPPPPPPGPGGDHGRRKTRIRDEAVTYAADSPLLSVTAIAQNPTDANALLGLLQPLGATRLALSVQVSGSLKDGGTANYSVTNAKPTNPVKPLDVGATLYRALQQGTFTAQARADFDGGKTDVGDALSDLYEKRPLNVEIEAEFGAVLVEAIP